MISGSGSRLSCRAAPRACTVRAQNLVSDFEAEHVIGDKGYDADSLIETVQQCGSTPVIPPRSCRKKPRDYDNTPYKERNKIERFFNRLK
ncbi:MAG: transposase [Rhodomicrobium sp.]|nr:transposase [Rhodomicrobium sp.]